MRTASVTIRCVTAFGLASLASGCVQPGYVVPGPVPLQPYPPDVTYQTAPDDRSVISGPIPLQAAPPPVRPLPSPVPPPVTEQPLTDPGEGAIPLQDLPAPAPSAAPTASRPAASAAPANPASAAPPEIIRKPAITTEGPGNNVPLEGFRPMHGKSAPLPTP